MDMGGMGIGIQHNLDEALATAEHVAGSQGQGVFLTEVFPALVDDGQPVGVGVLGEADVGLGLGHGLAQVAHVGEGGLRVAGEEPGGLAVHSHHRTAEFLQEGGGDE